MTSSPPPSSFLPFLLKRSDSEIASHSHSLYSPFLPLDRRRSWRRKRSLLLLVLAPEPVEKRGKSWNNFPNVLHFLLLQTCLGLDLFFCSCFPLGVRWRHFVRREKERNGGPPSLLTPKKTPEELLFLLKERRERLGQKQLFSCWLSRSSSSGAQIVFSKQKVSSKFFVFYPYFVRNLVLFRVFFREDAVSMGWRKIGDL